MNTALEINGVNRFRTQNPVISALSGDAGVLRTSKSVAYWASFWVIPDSPGSRPGEAYRQDPHSQGITETSMGVQTLLIASDLTHALSNAHVEYFS